MLKCFGFSEQALCQWPCLPQYMQHPLAFDFSFSAMISFLNFLLCGALFQEGKLARVISGLLGSLGLASWTLVHCCLVEDYSLGVATCHCYQIWSNFLASWTRCTRMVGAGYTAMILLWRAAGRFWRKENIFVSLFAQDRKVWVDHSWYHWLNSLFSILRKYICWKEMSSILTEMK